MQLRLRGWGITGRDHEEERECRGESGPAVFARVKGLPWGPDCWSRNNPVQYSQLSHGYGEGGRRVRS